jgi:hypothetical protein
MRMSNIAREDLFQPTAFEAPPEQKPAAMLTLGSGSVRSKVVLNLDATAETATAEPAEDDAQRRQFPPHSRFRTGRIAIAGANILLLVLFFILCGQLGYLDLLASLRTSVTATFRTLIEHNADGRSASAVPVEAFLPSRLAAAAELPANPAPAHSPTAGATMVEQRIPERPAISLDLAASTMNRAATLVPAISH